MTTVASLNTAITGDPSALINALNASTRAVTQFSTSVTQMNSRLNTGALSIGRLLATLGVGISVREVANYADAWTGVQARLGLVTDSTEELKRVTNDLFRIAQDNRAEFESTATLYTRLRQSQRQLGLESADFMRITRTVSQALAIEGRSAQEVSSTIRQLSQAFGAGRLAGDELRAVAENASLLFNKIAENLGLSTGELRRLSSEGKISIQQVAQAMLDAGDEIDRQAKRLPTTIGGALTQLRNSVQRFVGETDKALGITTGLVRMINALGDAFDNNRAAVETFAFVLGAAVLVKAANAARLALLQLAGVQLATTIISLIPAITSLRDAMYLLTVGARAMWAAIISPIGLAIVGITAAAAIFFKWRKSVEEQRKATEQLRASLQKLEPAELTRTIEASLRDLTRLTVQAIELRAALDRVLLAGGRPAPGQFQALADLQAQIDSVRKSLNEMIAIRNSAAVTGVTPPPIVTGDDDALKKFADGVQRVIETFKIMQAQGEHTHRVVDRLRSLFVDTQKKLRAIADPFSEEALRLRKILADLAELPEIKLRLRIDTSTREIRLMAEEEVKKLTEALTAKDSGLIPKITIQPIIDTSLAQRSMQQLTQRLPADMAAAIGRIRFDTLRDRLAQQLGSLPIKIEPAGIDIFNRAVDRAIEAQNRLNLARLGGDRAQIIDAEQQYARAVDTVREALSSLGRALDGANVKAEDQKLAIDAINEAAGKLQFTLTATVGRLDKFLNFARAATGIGRGILGIADAMRSVDENIRRSIASAINLTDAFADLIQAQKDLKAGSGSEFTVAASALGAAGAGLSLINSIVTAIRSDNEKLRQVIREQTSIQRENNRALERLRLDVGGFTGSVGDFRRAIGALRLPSQAPGAPSMMELIRQMGEFERRGTGPSTRNALEAALEAAGSSLAELNAIAETVSVELFDSAGRIIPDAFAILDDAIELHIKALTQWTRTLDDTRQRMELEANVFDFPATAQRSIEDGIKQLRTLAPAIFEKFFAGVNLEDAVQVETALRLLTRTLLDNIATLAGDFDALFGRDELIQIIEIVEQGLDSLAESTKEAAKASDALTASLLNVPQGFKLERFRFDATAARTAEEVRRLVADFRDAELTPKGKPGDRSTLVETIGRGSGDGITIFGDVYVDARDKPADELFDAVKLAAKNKARNSGLTKRPSDMLNV